MYLLFILILYRAWKMPLGVLHNNKNIKRCRNYYRTSINQTWLSWGFAMSLGEGQHIVVLPQERLGKQLLTDSQPASQFPCALGGDGDVSCDSFVPSTPYSQPTSPSTTVLAGILECGARALPIPCPFPTKCVGGRGCSSPMEIGLTPAQLLVVYILKQGSKKCPLHGLWGWAML